MDKTIISNHLYNDSISQAVNFVSSINDEETLFVYAYNYSWDNGFEVPTEILKNSNCTLNIALLIFNASDGILYLQDKEAADGTKVWINFISNLYKKILNNDFKKGKTSFDPQLSRVQKFKLKKVLSDEELRFIAPIEGIDCYINL